MTWLRRPFLYRAGILMGLIAVILLAPAPTRATTPRVHHITLDASRFAYTPGTIKVNPGDQVTIELRSLDVLHGLAIDGYAFELQAEPGQPDQYTFTAGEPGVFRMRCSVTCGNMHPFMVGKFQVGGNDLLWRAAFALGVLLLGLLVWRRP